MSFETKPLSEVLDYIRGITFKPDDLVEPYSEGSAICMRTKNIQKELDDSDVIAVPKSFVKRKEQYVEKGDILISSANSWELVGKSVRVPNIDYKCTAGGFISILRPKKGVVDPNYLYRFITYGATQHDIRHLGRQTTNISNLDRERFLKLHIPLPPLPVQKQIAALLEKADTLRNQCRQMEQELNQLAQSVFLEMFGDPLFNEHGFHKQQLIELVDDKDDIKCGPFGTQLGKDEYMEDGIPLWGIKHVNSGFSVNTNEFVTQEKAKELASYSLTPGDIVMTRKGTVGNCHIYPAELPPGVMHSDLLKIRVNEEKVAPEFLVRQFRISRDIKKQMSLISQGAIMAGINVSKLKQLMVIVPPIELQMKYVSIIESIENTKKTNGLNGNRAQFDELFNSLMQRAFKGQLKLGKAA